MITTPPTLPFAEFFSIQKPNIRLSITHKPPNTHTERERERERERSSQAFKVQGHRFIQGFTRTHFEFLSLFLVFICLIGNIGGFSFSCC